MNEVDQLLFQLVESLIFHQHVHLYLNDYDKCMKYLNLHNIFTTFIITDIQSFDTTEI